MTRALKRIRHITLNAPRLTLMTSAQNDDTTIGMAYDSLGNMLQETQAGKSVQSVYNDLSFRTSFTYPNSRQITFVPDNLSRIDQVKESSNVIADYTYGGPYRVTQRDYLNGTSLSVSYDGARRATNYVHYYSTTTITGFAYAYDKEDNKKYEKRTHTTKGDAYNYDSIYRLIGVKYGVLNSSLNPSTPYANYTGDSEEVFGLDGVGNRISVTHGSSINYSTNSLNQYEQIDSATLDYDNNGNLISGTANTCIFDYANRLLKVTRTSDDRILAEYKYDALGRRFYKKGWDGSQHIETYFYYDGARCIEERNTGDTVVAQYTFGNGIDEVLTMERNGETYYYHANSLGSIYALTDSNGDVAERYSYDAYGKPSFYDGAGNPLSGSVIGNNILFTGRYYDAETGLYDYRNRTLSTDLGRFLQHDPAEDDNLLNLYTYVGNNPVNYLDPLGLYTRDLTGFERLIVMRAIGRLKQVAKRFDKEGQSQYAKIVSKLAVNLEELQYQEGKIIIDSDVWEEDKAFGKTDKGIPKIRLAPEVFLKENVNEQIVAALFHEKFRYVYHSEFQYWIATFFGYGDALMLRIEGRILSPERIVIDKDFFAPKLSELEWLHKENLEKEESNRSKKCDNPPGNRIIIPPLPDIRWYYYSTD